jgi:hypothetical protein
MTLHRLFIIVCFTVLFLFQNNNVKAQIADCIGAQYVCQNSYAYPAGSIGFGNVMPINEFPIRRLTPLTNNVGGGCLPPLIGMM